MTQVSALTMKPVGVVIPIRLSREVAGLCVHHEGLIPPLLTRDVNIMTRLLACG